jgi:hypothetical protein
MWFALFLLHFWHSLANTDCRRSTAHSDFSARTNANVTRRVTLG